jgi:hypothetical protein
MSATARDMLDSPNPDFNRPINKHPDQVKAECYEYHKNGGTLGDYYAAYPSDTPWDYGLTPEEREAAFGRFRER